jgi:hypothetical protein
LCAGARHARAAFDDRNTLNLLLALPAVAIALALKPWRLLRSPPPWPALAVWAALPLLWSLDATTASPLLQPLSGVCILLLMLGWPLTVLALLPVGGVMWLASGLDAGGALHRVVWLGLVPATLALALGAGVRRWLPRHLFVYIMGRGFFATALALTLSAAGQRRDAGSPALGLRRRLHHRHAHRHLRGVSARVASHLHRPPLPAALNRRSTGQRRTHWQHLAQRRRPVQQEALRVVDAQFAHPLQHLGTVDELGHRAHTQHARHLNEAAQGGRVQRVVDQIADELAVDLDQVHA